MRHLHLVRNDLMGPLSAASMEMGSYHRGYEYIVRRVILRLGKYSDVHLSLRQKQRELDIRRWWSYEKYGHFIYV